MSPFEYTCHGAVAPVNCSRCQYHSSPSIYNGDSSGKDGNGMGKVDSKVIAEELKEAVASDRSRPPPSIVDQILSMLGKNVSRWRH